MFETLARLCNVPHAYYKNTDPTRHYQISTPEKNIKIASLMMDIDAFLLPVKKSLAAATSKWATA